FKNPQQANSLINDFFNEFMSLMNNFIVEQDDLIEPYDEVIYNQIHEMQKLRDDYIEFLNHWVQVRDIFNIDKIITFFEKIYKFSDYQGNGSFNETQTEHYKFLITELFLYTCAILLKNELYEQASILINNKYFIEQRFSSNDNPTYFTCFNFGTINSLEYRNRRLGTRLYSYTADTLINRANINGISYISELTETDLLLYYISNLKTGKAYDCWFPLTYKYAGNGRSYYSYKLNILKKLISRRHFEKIKILFEVNTIEELKQLFNNFSEDANNYMSYSGGSGHVMPLKHHIDYDEIGTSI
ncbi:hypothetical protein IJ732_08520, partial [bacterium]|nr:hypothetical protein [bacterium]